MFDAFHLLFESADFKNICAFEHFRKDDGFAGSLHFEDLGLLTVEDDCGQSASAFHTDEEVL